LSLHRTDGFSRSRVRLTSAHRRRHRGFPPLATSIHSEAQLPPDLPLLSTHLGVPFKASKHRRLRTAVAGDTPPVMGLPCLSELPRCVSGRVLVRGSLPAVPPAARSSTRITVRGHGPGCSLRLERPCTV
jgi:hypothetical protein